MMKNRPKLTVDDRGKKQRGWYQEEEEQQGDPQQSVSLPASSMYPDMYQGVSPMP